MPEADKCPQCGTPLSPGALAGLCPACLLKAGAADTVTDARQPSFTPPGVGELAAKFPQLEILELIGQGGMGAVYKARQKQLDRIVALKILPPNISSDATFAERFTREARALAKLNHPNIVTLYEFGETGGQFYFLMEFVDGVNLRQLLNNSRLSAREALAIVPQICDALQFAHDHGIVHRDIKPENILLDRRGRVKVADFGLAKIIGGESGEPAASGQSSAGSTTLTDAGKVMGTPRYMSPEQKENPREVDHRADIYALGVVFYQMLTGELPGKRIEPPSKKVQIDVRLDEIVLRALEKKPELRFQQASVFKTQLETIAETPPPNKTVPPLLNKSDTFLRWFAVTTLAMIVVLFVIAVLGLIAAVAIPNFIKAREKSLALNQQQVKTTPEASSNFSIGQAYFPRGDSIEITSVERNEDQITVKGHYHLDSADNATLTLNITTSAPSHHSQDPKQSLQIVNGEGDFELIHSHVEPGMPHVNMYYGGRPFAELYFGTKEEAAREANLDLQHELSGLMDDATLGFNPVIETVVESGDDKKGYDLDRARVDYVGTTWDSRADLAVRESPDGKQALYFVGTRVEGFPDGEARWRAAAWVIATNLALIPESPEAFTNAYRLSWHAATVSGLLDQPATYEFKTREGNLGVLQVMGLTENPRGVKIRYKLMRKMIESPNIDSSLKMLSDQPPVVVETYPISGARDVEPGEAEIRVRFSKAMTDGSWSWSSAGENSTPEFIGSPHYAADGKTCVARVKLEPDLTYAFWLNSDNFQNFKDADGRPAVPYLLIFQTKQK